MGFGVYGFTWGIVSHQFRWPLCHAIDMTRTAAIVDLLSDIGFVICEHVQIMVQITLRHKIYNSWEALVVHHCQYRLFDTSSQRVLD